MKRLLSVLLAFVLCLSVFPVTAAAADPFTDVSSDQWYYEDVTKAYELGLINGKTETLFKPNDNLTYAEAVKLAACMHQLYTKQAVTMTNGDPWYQTYVDYCRENGIISKAYDWDESATRAGYMEIFSNALPVFALKEFNDVPDGAIPDVPVDHPQAEAIYRLYRAGIVQGVDEAHSCKPDDTIKRSEVAAILIRMMDERARISFTMNGMKITMQPVDTPAADTVTFRVEVTGGTQPYTYRWESTFVHQGKIMGWATMYDPEAKTTYNRPELTIEVSDDFRKSMEFITVLYRCVITDQTGKSLTTDEVRILP